MIDAVRLTNFKCFKELRLPLRQLSVLTGFNAAGKSTAIQSALLLAQAIRMDGRTFFVPLNGPLVRLGTPGDVINTSGGTSSGNQTALGAEGHGVQLDWVLGAATRSDDTALNVQSISLTKDGSTESASAEGPLGELLPLTPTFSAGRELVAVLRDIIFISAARIGQADTYPIPDSGNPIHADVGTQGEYAPWWFDRLSDYEIDSARCHPSGAAGTLRRQFSAWASTLFPGVEANVIRVQKTPLVQLELRNSSTGPYRRPANIGYGLTYAFPILVAGLLARRGQILIVDSPEAHLHPKAQSAMGSFLSSVANAGVQVIIETHSDHILSGVRLAALGGQIPPLSVSLHFFSPVPSNPHDPAQVISPELDSSGNVSEWPPGFFDQAEKDLARLAGWE